MSGVSKRGFAPLKKLFSPFPLIRGRGIQGIGLNNLLGCLIQHQGGIMLEIPT